jgi:hypothetical protein
MGRRHKDASDLHDHRHAGQQDDFMAPIELISFARRKAQRDVGRGGRLPMLLGPSSGVAAQRIVAAVIAASAELASGFGCIDFQQRAEPCRPSPQLRPRLNGRLVFERCLS